MRTLRNRARTLPPKSKKTMQILLTALIGLGLTLGWGFISILQAQEHREEAEKEGKIKIPATLPEVWQEVKEHQGELHEVLAAKKLKEVHLVAFAIRDYVAAMPKKSTQLTLEKKAVLGKSVSRVASLAKYLDEAGDAGDSAKVATLVARLDKELIQIEALYPAKALKAAKASSGTETAPALYYCTMHPDLVSDKPGKCSKCGMVLVRKEEAK